MSHNLGMKAGRESDGRVLPAKCPNKGGSLSPAGDMEGRRPTKENTGQRAASQMQSWGNALAGLRREERGPGLLQLSRCTRKFRRPLEFSFRDTQTLVACNSTSQSAEPDDLGAPGALGGSVAPHTQDSSSISHGAL